MGALWTSNLLDKFMENSALDSNLSGEMHLGRTLHIIFLCWKRVKHLACLALSKLDRITYCMKFLCRQIIKTKLPA